MAKAKSTNLEFVDQIRIRDSEIAQKNEKMASYAISLFNLSDLLMRSEKSKNGEVYSGDDQLSLIEVIGDYVEWLKMLIDEKRELEHRGAGLKVLKMGKMLND